MNDPMKFRKEAAAIKEQIEIVDQQIAAAEETAAEIEALLPQLCLTDEKAAQAAITERNRVCLQRDFRRHQRTGLLQQLEALRVPVLREEIVELKQKHAAAARDCETAIAAAGKAEAAFHLARQVVANLRAAMAAYGEAAGEREWLLQQERTGQAV